MHSSFFHLLASFLRTDAVVTTTAVTTAGHSVGTTAVVSARIPYGLPCVRELLRFLVSLTNPHDRHNTDMMIHMGLSLLMVALESGADSIPNYKSLLGLVRDDMCKNLISVRAALL